MSGRGVLRPYLLRHWSALGTAGLATIVVTLAELAQPWPLKIALDRILRPHPGPFSLDSADYRMLALLAGAVVAITIAGACASYFADLALRRAGERILHDLRVATYAQLQRLSLTYHHRRPTGDLVSRVTGDVNAIGTLFTDSVGGIVASALVLVGMATISFAIDPLLALAAFAVTPVLATVTFYYRRRVKELARRQRAGEGEIASRATEALSAISVVKAFGSESFERSRVERLSEVRQDLGIETARLEARFSAVVDVLGAVASVTVVALGVLRVAAGAVSAGDLVVFATYATRTYKPLRQLARQTTAVAVALARAERIREVLEADELLEEQPGAVAPRSTRGAVELEHVTFAYAHDRPALCDLSLRIAAGSTVAMVGASGAGKSTLGALVARFYDPSSGRVLLDGQDLRELPVGFLRSEVAFLLQDTILFGGSVAENIAYATDASPHEIEAAAAAAGATEFIDRLPDGYDTQLGPRGVGLSGGQRQRIGIARVLLRDPAVLILDEPTIGLDAATEAGLLQSLSRVMAGRTSLLVTHSIALAARCDQVVVLDRGEIAQQGTPAELLARGGQFGVLARHQSIDVGQAARLMAAV